MVFENPWTILFIVAAGTIVAMVSVILDRRFTKKHGNIERGYV